MISRTALKILTGILILQIGCNKEKEYTGDTNFGSKVMILGHAGMGIYFNMPQNSLESISTAIAIGCDGSEMDVQLTKDSILIAYHDDFLSGQTNCEGRVSDQNWTDIRSCKFDLATKPVFLMPIEELFNKFPNLTELYFSFDCKTEVLPADKDAYEDRFLRAVKRLCDKYKMGNHVLLEGHAGFLDKAAKMGLENKCFLLSNNDDNPAEKAKQKYFGISTVMEISEEDILRANNNGLYVMVWDPDNYSQNKSVLDRKPDIIQTDDPISILKLLKRYNYENVTP